MGAKTLISPEEYLSMSFEWEPEYVQGELRQRPMPELIHAWIIKTLITLLDRVDSDRTYALSEVRCRMPNGNFRLPDVALFRGSQPAVPVEPVLVAIEVLSKREDHDELMEKLADYEAWGVPHIWVIHPRRRTLQQYRDGSLQRVDSLKLPEYGFEVKYEQLVEKLPTATAPLPHD